MDYGLGEFKESKTDCYHSGQDTSPTCKGKSCPCSSRISLEKHKSAMGRAEREGRKRNEHYSKECTGYKE